MFVEDISAKGMIHALTLRSPVASGKLIRIESPKLPNSYVLITAKDIPGKNQLDDFPVPVLASDIISYIGEPIALLAGPDIAKLEEYADRCVISIEESQPQFSSRVTQDSQIMMKRSYGEASEHEAASAVTGYFTTGIQEHWYSEPTGALAVYAKNKITIHTATQWPYHVKRSVAGLFNMDSSAVQVEPTKIGVHLDGKLWYPSLIGCQAALCAWITQKPVKLMLTREEDFRYSPKRNGSEIQMRSDLDENGKLVSTEIRADLNLGAQGIFTDEIVDQSSLGCLGIYNLGKVKLETYGVRSNIPPQGPMAGFGLSQGFFAIERHVSRIADSLHQDPAEWRKNNFIDKGNNLAIGIPIKDHVPMAELIDTAAAMGDYYRKWASYELLRSRRQEKDWDARTEPIRGIGMAAAYQGSGFLYTGGDKGIYTVEVTLQKDSTLEIKTSMVSSGGGYSRIWQSIAAEHLSVEAANVKVINTSASPDSGPATLSRDITLMSKLVEKCCQAIRKQRFRDPLPITVKRSSKSEKLIPWGLTPPLEASQKPIDPGAFAHCGWGAAAVEAEIDAVSLQPVIRGIWLAVDGGKILSQARARLSLKTAVIQALGWSCREQLSYNQGVIEGGLVHGYDITAPIEAPPIHIDFLWNDAVPPKGIGEIPFSCVPAAYAQAVSQAMNHPFEKIPISARDLWEASHLKKQEKAAEASV
ncbi:xanthine dehydrogenase family protein molybdopterin-binding subunit [Leadbettera azotonutricia]|uniref:Conserved hypothetical xanthine dehydrogenase n=1 Tax=Leadbettera azotonutricia (strain ATCC BAA-888 / DSM 13862 / ZAS-9) TaxID=545695 RepID=F5YAW7_LEAAZ|nr:molybdopterin cofactor-binding domain-containing protein [Leadbettera azotonutricia]AEF81648.1 conserved hypothetical xanthine dehydrogenase [Leadbettera azotonutricia ZAS-9]